MRNSLTVWMILTFLAAVPPGVSGEAVEEIGPGSPAPHFSVISLDGDRLDSGDLRGRVLVLNFWYIACPPCRTEIPRLNRLVQDMQGRDVVFIAFSPDPPEDLHKFLARFEFKYRIVPDSTPIAELFRVTGAPTHIVIDRQGRIAAIRRGEIRDPESELKRLIEGLL